MFLSIIYIHFKHFPTMLLRIFIIRVFEDFSQCVLKKFNYTLIHFSGWYKTYLKLCRHFTKLQKNVMEIFLKCENIFQLFF